MLRRNGPVVESVESVLTDRDYFRLAVTCLKFPIQVCFSATVAHLSLYCTVAGFPNLTFTFSRKRNIFLLCP